MKKALFIGLIAILTISQSAFAEKTPVKIAPTEIISTHHDEVEVADWIHFEIVTDVYVNDKLYIAKGTPIYGFVDFFKPNGWAGDSAEIKFKTFETKDVNGKKLTLSYPLNITGNSLKTNDIKQYLSWEIFAFIRGAEIYVEPDGKVFNLFITQ